MKQEDIRALADNELTQVITWAQTEIAARTERKKRETIAKIKELAGAVGVSVTIGGVRGRPVKARAGAKSAQARKAASKQA